MSHNIHTAWIAVVNASGTPSAIGRKNQNTHCAYRHPFGSKAGDSQKNARSGYLSCYEILLLFMQRKHSSLNEWILRHSLIQCMFTLYDLCLTLPLSPRICSPFEKRDSQIRRLRDIHPTTQSVTRRTSNCSCGRASRRCHLKLERAKFVGLSPSSKAPTSNARLLNESFIHIAGSRYE